MGRLRAGLKGNEIEAPPPNGGVREGGLGPRMAGESGDGGKGRRFCCCLPDFSDDMPVVLLGQSVCSASRGPWLASESRCADCAAGSSTEMER